MPTPASPRTRRAGIPGRPPFGGARGLAALALSAAAGIHVAQAVRHLSDGSSSGRLHAGFFVAASLVQIVSVLAVRARRGLGTVALVNLSLATVWAVSVTVGLPQFLSPTGPEAVTVPGALAATLAVAASVALTVPGPRRAARPLPAGVSAGFAAPTAVACLALVAGGWALPASGDAHDHAAHTHSGPGHSAAGHGPLALDGVHLHGLGGDPDDPGPDPRRQAKDALAGTRLAAGRSPAGVAVSAGVVWVTDREGGTVVRLDERTGRALGPPIPVGVHPGGVAVGAGGVWVANAGSDSVTRLDPASGQPVATISVGRVPVGVAVGAGSVWVTNSAEGTVSRIEPATGLVVTTERIGYGPTAIVVAAGRPWVVASLDRAVVSLDPASGTVATTTPVDAGPASIAFGHGSLWVASSSAGTVTRIDPATGARMGTPVVVDGQAQPGQGPAALAVGARVSVLNNHDKTVVTIDPSTHAVSAPQFIDRHVARSITPAALAVGAGGELWATEHEGGIVVRLPA